MTTWITICDTCKSATTDPATPATDHSNGQDLAALIEARAPAPLRTRRVSCLMGCGHGCNVAIQAEGKLCYTLGRFEPTAEAAQGIVDYALLHSASKTGQVPFRDWPAAIKGHFITRHPPLPRDPS